MVGVSSPLWRTPPTPTRASKKDWLDAALDHLLREGTADLKVERLVQELAVTKGSFYWYVKGREEPLQQAAAHWHATQLAFLDALRSADHPTPEDRLEAVLEFIEAKDARADVAVRLWARRAP